MTKPTHIHKFKRLRYKSGNEIFFCCLPDCNVKINVALALGKRSICWRCAEPFVLNEYSLRLTKPHCDNCHKPKMTKEATEIAETHAEAADTTSLAYRLSQAILQAKQSTKEKENNDDEI